MKQYQVIEDNGGNMYLFFFNEGKVILGLPGDLDNISFNDALDWDNPLSDPQAVYDNIISYEFGWDVVADQDGIYPDLMGRAAQIVYHIETEEV
ncbi:MAG: hypothetical protein ACYSQZ_06675 [Planctomycetota bacterium]|jgi:hypothetical protein